MASFTPPVARSTLPSFFRPWSSVRSPAASFARPLRSSFVPSPMGGLLSWGRHGVTRGAAGGCLCLCWPLMTGENDVPELVASVGPLDPVVVLLREFLHRSGALRAVAVVAGEPGEDPAVVDVRRLPPTEVEVAGRVVLLPHAIELDAPPPPAGLPSVRQMAPF